MEVEGRLVVGRLPSSIPPPGELLDARGLHAEPAQLSRRGGAGGLYVAGGNDGTSCLNSVERYSPKAGAWESVAPMNTKVHGPKNCHHHCPLCSPN